MINTNMYRQDIRHKEDELSIQYLAAVKAMAFRLKERLPSLIDFMDLWAIGTEELIKLARRYDEKLNDSFWAYALALVGRDELVEVIKNILSNFKEREQLVIQFYYFEELTLKEISEILHITESRISQIHKAVVYKIKESVGA